MIPKPTLSLAAAFLLTSLGAVSLSACDSDEGPAEEAGETIDEGVSDTKRGVEDATD